MKTDRRNAIKIIVRRLCAERAPRRSIFEKVLNWQDRCSWLCWPVSFSAWAATEVALTTLMVTEIATGQDRCSLEWTHFPRRSDPYRCTFCPRDFRLRYCDRPTVLQVLFLANTRRSCFLERLVSLQSSRRISNCFHCLLNRRFEINETFSRLFLYRFLYPCNKLDNLNLSIQMILKINKFQKYEF